MNVNLEKQIKVIIVVMTLLFSVNTFAQPEKLGTWNILNVEYNLNKKWIAFVENQFRSQKMFDDFFYHELKAAVGYNLSDKVSLLVGNGFYQTYSNGGNFKSPVTSSEYRIWQQLVLINDIGRLKLEHRYRTEQRWLSEGFRNRFRYRLNAMLPINKPSIENGALFASVYDEVFFTDLNPHFLRNRFYAGLGYQFAKQFTLQLGFIRQYDYTLTESSAKNFIQTSLFFKLHGQDGLHRHYGPMD